MKNITQSAMFRNRGLIGVICLTPVAILVLFSQPIIPEDSFADIAMEACGWVFLCLYLGMRIWATLFVGGRKDSQLQTAGPYSITRNPLYLGSFFYAISCAFFFNSFILLLSAVTSSIIYLKWVVAAEEKLLETHFGDAFRAYCLRTPRFFPKFSNFHSPETLEVKFKALKIEMKRLLLAGLLPLGGEIVAHLRSAPRWPHWFTFF
jgi:protein-S-isoprenylcysteine O-methyltransferase Ste14